MDSRIAQLERLLQDGQAFDFHNFCLPHPSGSIYGGPDSPEWGTWKIRAKNIVEQTLSKNSPSVKLIDQALSVRTYGNHSNSFEEAKLSILKAITLSLQALKEDIYNEVIDPSAENIAPNISNRVFIVHGHDHALKNELEAFLHQLGLEPVVLHKKPDEGQTVIEKFEQHSDVGFAFVLLTPDEIAYTAEQERIDDNDRTKEKRARPNVIFEFGYFVAKLGRNRVCCLYRGEVTVPSDLSGLLYKKVEPSLESQAFSIIKELKAAGYSLRL